MTGVEVLSWSIAIGLVGGLIVGSWWSPLAVFAAVLIALLTRDAIEDPDLRPGASEDTTFTRSVFWAMYSAALVLSALAGTAASKGIESSLPRSAKNRRSLSGGRR